MRAFAQAPKATQQATSAKPTIPDRAHCGQSGEMSLSEADTVDVEGRLTPTKVTRFGHDLSRIPAHAKVPVKIQAKLTVNTPGDIYEQEADRVAEEVVRMPETQLQPSCACDGRCPKCQTQQPDWPHKLASSGQPLYHSTRRFMESRFGHDFSDVRVHTDSRAAESAGAVHALAYTVGRNIVFGAGQFSPQSIKGKRLLAHELAHVVQQTTATSSPFHLQRKPDKKRKRRDVVLLGEGVIGGEELSHVLARGGLIIRVKSLREVVEELAKIAFPVGTLYFVAHSAATGALKFGEEEGFIELTDITSKLKGVLSTDNAPSDLDFRGCSVGTSPNAMEKIRAALGAKSVIAGNCYAVISHSVPIKIGNKLITKASDVTTANRAQFKELMNVTVNNFGAKKNCIINRSETAFFAAGGRFVSLWFTPTFTKEWLEGKSVCYKDINPQTVGPDKALSEIQGCRLIKVEVDASFHGAEGRPERGRNIPPP